LKNILIIAWQFSLAASEQKGRADNVGRRATQAADLASVIRRKTYSRGRAVISLSYSALWTKSSDCLNMVLIYLLAIGCTSIGAAHI